MADHRRLEPLLDPRSIAVVGASDDPVSIRGRALSYLLRTGYPRDRLHPVNPHRTTVQGLFASRSIDEVPGPVDLALVAVPASEVPGVVSSCARVGVRAVVVFSSGFAEMGPAGVALQAELAAAAAESPTMLLLGPNCLGVVNVRRPVTATFTSALDAAGLLPGVSALVTQSGAVGSMLLGVARAEHLGMAYFVSTGNEEGMSVAELVAALVEDPDVQVVLAYLEGVRDAAALLDAARRGLELGKPIVALKAGRSDAGRRAALSHTASLAGEDIVADGAFDQAAIVRVDGLADLLDAGRVFAAGRRAAGRRVSVVTISGGVGVLMADRCDSLGLELAKWDGEWKARMERLVPPFGSASNPIDVTATLIARPDLLDHVLDLCGEHPGTDAVAVLLGNVTAGEDRVVDTLVRTYGGTEKPIVVTWVGGSGRPASALADAGIPVYPDPDRALRALKALVEWSERAMAPPHAARRRRSHLPAWLFDHPGGLMDEVESKALLARYGIATVAEVVVADEAAAVAAAARIGGPVAVKLLAPDVVHKTDLGAVVLDVFGDEEVASAFRRVTTAGRLAGAPQVDGIVQAMAPSGVELLLGARIDAQWGPIVLVGMGGVLAEVLADVRAAVAPIDERAAERLVGRLRGSRLLDGFRGRGPLDRAAACAALCAVSELAADLGDRLVELDVNPLVVAEVGQGSVVVDASIRLSPLPPSRPRSPSPRAR